MNINSFKKILLLVLVTYISSLSQDWAIGDDVDSTTTGFGTVNSHGSYYDLVIPIGFSDLMSSSSE